MSDTVHFNEALDRRYAAGRQNDCSVKMIARKRAFKPFQTNAADGKAADRSQALPQAAASLAELIRLAEVRGMVRALGQRGDPVFEFDASGAVVCSHGLESLENGPLRIVSQRLRAVTRRAQHMLDAAIFLAARLPAAASAVALTDSSGRTYLMRLMPVLCSGHEPLNTTAAIAVLTGLLPKARADADSVMISALYDVTAREIEVIRYLCGGFSVSAAATEMGVAPGTVRFHLRSIFAKTGVKRQTELIARLARLDM